MKYCKFDDSQTKKLVKNTYSLNISRNKGNVNQANLTKPQIERIAEALNHFPKRVSVSVGGQNYDKEALDTFGFDVLSEDTVMNKMRSLTTNKINNIIDSVHR